MGVVAPLPAVAETRNGFYTSLGAEIDNSNIQLTIQGQNHQFAVWHGRIGHAQYGNAFGGRIGKHHKCATQFTGRRPRAAGRNSLTSV